MYTHIHSRSFAGGANKWMCNAVKCIVGPSFRRDLKIGAKGGKYWKLGAAIFFIQLLPNIAQWGPKLRCKMPLLSSRSGGRFQTLSLCLTRLCLTLFFSRYWSDVSIENHAQCTYNFQQLLLTSHVRILLQTLMAFHVHLCFCRGCNGV